MFVGRNASGSIYGTWTVEQPDDEFHPGMEELPDNHPDVVAFINRPRPVAQPDQRTLAIEALLVKAALDPLAPQAVKDFAATLK